MIALIIIFGYVFPALVPVWTACGITTAEELAMLGMATAEEHTVFGMAVSKGHARVALATSGVILGAKHVKTKRQEHLRNPALTRKLYRTVNVWRGNTWLGHDRRKRQVALDLTTC